MWICQTLPHERCYDPSFYLWGSNTLRIAIVIVVVVPKTINATWNIIIVIFDHHLSICWCTTCLKKVIFHGILSTSVATWHVLDGQKQMTFLWLTYECPHLIIFNKLIRKYHLFTNLKCFFVLMQFLLDICMLRDPNVAGCVLQNSYHPPSVRCVQKYTGKEQRRRPQ